jgi:hypothetical protein
MSPAPHGSELNHLLKLALALAASLPLPALSQAVVNPVVTLLTEPQVTYVGAPFPQALRL